MSDPVIAQKSPYPVEVVEGKKIFLVLLRQKRSSTLLRWISRGNRFFTANLYRTRYQNFVFLWMQTHKRRAAV